MASEANQLHFVCFPFMAQGHMIPMIDIARLLAQRGVVITIVTTPLNAARFESSLNRAIESGLQIRIIQLKFPCLEAGLPEGCENLDMIESLGLYSNFFTAADTLKEPVEEFFGGLKPRPSCIISDTCLPYTAHIAKKFEIPRISFHGVCCFCILCFHKVKVSNVLQTLNSETEYFVVPDMPDKVEFTKQQIISLDSKLSWIIEKISESELDTYGVIVNSFEELEPAYVEEYKKEKDNKVWCIGPVSLYNKDYSDMSQRGIKTAIDDHQVLKWLDSKEPSSVIYACLGSLCNVVPSQLLELGLGLEASNKPFIWVIRGGDTSKELEKWISEDGFEERIKGRGFLIRGWAPQVTTSTNLVTPRNRWILNTLRLELNTRRSVCWPSIGNLAAVRRPILYRETCCSNT